MDPEPSDPVQNELWSEAGEIPLQGAEGTRDQEKPQHHKENPGEDLQDREEPPEPSERPQECIQGQGREKEGHGQAQGVDKKKSHPGPELVLGRSKGEDGPQNRPDAGRPACPESCPDTQRSQISRRFVMEVEPPLSHEGGEVGRPRPGEGPGP